MSFNKKCRTLEGANSWCFYLHQQKKIAEMISRNTLLFLINNHNKVFLLSYIKQCQWAINWSTNVLCSQLSDLCSRSWILVQQSYQRSLTNRMPGVSWPMKTLLPPYCFTTFSLSYGSLQWESYLNRVYWIAAVFRRTTLGTCLAPAVSTHNRGWKYRTQEAANLGEQNQFWAEHKIYVCIGNIRT